jgi:pyridoxamine 5'-phosphate oxidase
MINSLTNSDALPLTIAREWLEEAKSSEAIDYNAMALATADEHGLPNVRMVLLKGFSDDDVSGGFVFYTNMTSQKGAEIRANMQAAINFHWKSAGRCLRARGKLEIVSEEESDAYFQSRSRGSRLASMASDQSSPLASREELMARVAQLEARYGKSDETGEKIPRPEHWYGHRLVPSYLEFWQDGEFRMHDRFACTRDRPGAQWVVQRLNP